MDFDREASNGCECHHTSTTDAPDLMFEDSNCDGIDGVGTRAIFVSPSGDDANDGTARLERPDGMRPVLTVTPFTDERQAVALANGLGYGLVAGVYTRDISRALRLAQELEAGSVWINGWFIGGQQAPTGGIKDSGVGRERGLPGLRNYLSTKNVGIRL